MKTAPFTGRTALVTGASSGLGADFARQLAALGADLILTARRTEALEALAAEIRRAQPDRRVTVVPADLAAPSGPDALAAQIAAQGLPVDILINNAGFGAFGPFDSLPWDKELTMLNLDIAALVRLTKLFAPAMKNVTVNFSASCAV